MGIWNKLFGSPPVSSDADRSAQIVEPSQSVDAAPADDAPRPPSGLPVKLDQTDRTVLQTLANTASGMSAEDIGQKLGLENMLCLYRLDKLVKSGLVKRSRPMFREPELYEVTELGRERMLA